MMLINYWARLRTVCDAAKLSKVLSLATVSMPAVSVVRALKRTARVPIASRQSTVAVKMLQPQSPHRIMCLHVQTMFRAHNHLISILPHFLIPSSCLCHNHCHSCLPLHYVQMQITLIVESSLNLIQLYLYHIRWWNHRCLYIISGGITTSFYTYITHPSFTIYSCPAVAWSNPATSINPGA